VASAEIRIDISGRLSLIMEKCKKPGQKGILLIELMKKSRDGGSDRYHFGKRAKQKPGNGKICKKKIYSVPQYRIYCNVCKRQIII